MRSVTGSTLGDDAFPKEKHLERMPHDVQALCVSTKEHSELFTLTAYKNWEMHEFEANQAACAETDDAISSAWQQSTNWFGIWRHCGFPLASNRQRRHLIKCIFAKVHPMEGSLEFSFPQRFRAM